MNKKKFFTAVSAGFAIAAVFLISLFVCINICDSITVRIRYLFLIAAGCILCTLAAAVFVCFSVSDERLKKYVIRGIMIYMFLIYLVIFVITVFAIKAFSNHQSFVFGYNKRWLADSLPGLIPFRSIVRDFKEFAVGKQSMIWFFFEMFGNMAAYIPIAFFIPAFFKSMRKFDSFFPFIVFVTVFVEFFQGMFGLGSCKFDDFLLGAGAACAAFAFFRTNRVQKFLDKYYINF